MNEYLFSYGTLQNGKVQLELFGRILNGSADMLIGYKVATIEIKDELFLSKGEEKYQQTVVFTNDKNDSIQGTFLEITKEELFLADKYEPDNYKRTKLALESAKQTCI